METIRGTRRHTLCAQTRTAHLRSSIPHSQGVHPCTPSLLLARVHAYTHPEQKRALTQPSPSHNTWTQPHSLHFAWVGTLQRAPFFNQGTHAHTLPPGSQGVHTHAFLLPVRVCTHTPPNTHTRIPSLHTHIPLPREVTHSHTNKFRD